MPMTSSQVKVFIYSQPRSQSSSAISDVTSHVKPAGYEADMSVVLRQLMVFYSMVF